MRFFKYFALVLIVFTVHAVQAQTTFLVTSNADSGPGTLRDALTQANATSRTGTFTINFQLPGSGTDNANRTIRLRTALPVVSSNVIIDGSSQASWTALGISGAKIIIEPEYANSTFSGLTIGQYSSTAVQTTGIEIYGLYIRNFATISNLQNVNTAQGSGIVIDYRANNITIGAPGKGNVIGGNIYGILMQNSYYYSNITATRIKIQSNFIGVIYDGTTPNTNVYGISANLYDSSLDIGGDNTGEGNVVAANRINIDITRSSYATNARFDVNVINNKIGVDYTGVKDFHELPIFLSSSSLEIAGLKVNAINTALYVRKNIIGGNRTTGISITNSDFILTGNSIGTDATGTVVMGNGIGIKIESNAGGTIGGATTAEANLIANNNFGIETVSARAVKITRNSMFCNKTFGIGKTLTITQPFIQILRKRADYVSGKATANSEVELFYTYNCNGICEGKTYIATVQAGSDGRWAYNGTLTGMVTATASLLNATTSPFSTAELLANEAVVEPVTCNANGSITIPEVREGFTFSWVKIETDGTRLPIGTTQSISNLDVGTYEVTIDDGCKAFPSVFIIKDQKLTKPTISASTPVCGQTAFTFTAEVLRGKGVIKYEWYNASNTLVSTSNPTSLPEGKYYVRVTDEAGCKLDSDPLTITRKAQPKINNTNISNPGAACGKLNGSIKGITVSDITGTATYKWFKRNPTTGALITPEIATTLDLENVEGGNYTLFVYDDGPCSGVQQNYTISVYNTIVISGASLIQSTTCNYENGVIDGIYITDANQYEWKRSDGSTIGTKTAYAPGTLLRITDLAPGRYTLYATNTLTTCPPVSRDFTVAAIAPTVYTYTPTINKTTCGVYDNGSITLSFTSIMPTRYEWRDESGNVFPGLRTANSIDLKNIPSGNYRLFAYDVNNCQTVLGPFSIDITDRLNIVANTGRVVKDGCSLQRGSVTGVVVNGGVPSYNFKWVDANGDAVQYTQDLINVGAGVYRLQVTDKTSCAVEISQPYTIIDEPFKIETPLATDIRVCYESEITIPIIGAQEGTYQLFANLTDAKPILESKTGVFKYKIGKTGDYYIRRKLGSCVSEFAMLHVEVTFDNIEVTNTMTPNGDQRNDYWMVRGLPDYTGTNIKIYTRSGQLVYESIGNYTKPFDGRFRGEELPAGVYYYIIDLRSECKPLSGSITLLR